MFEALVGMCIILSPVGDRVNPCWIKQDKKVYMSRQACESDARRLEREYVSRLVNKSDQPATAHVVCSPMKGSQS